MAAIRLESTRGAVRDARGVVYGARGLLAAGALLNSALRELKLDEVAGRALQREAFAIDAMFFDKHVHSNWAVPSHQDVVVPVPVTSESGGEVRLARRARRWVSRWASSTLG